MGVSLGVSLSVGLLVEGAYWWAYFLTPLHPLPWGYPHWLYSFLSACWFQGSIQPL